MFKKNNLILMISLSTLFLLISACSLATQKQDAQITQKAGVQLWAENCSSCHNMRPPDSYSDAQWDVAVLHMRVRANLTAIEARSIAKYLKSAN